MRALYVPISAAACGLLAISAAGQTADSPPDRREEIIVHPKPAGPLDDWSQIQAHDAEYHRLKAKFDPDRRQTRMDGDAADRDFAAPGGVHALQAEREAPVAVEGQP